MVRRNDGSRKGNGSSAARGAHGGDRAPVTNGFLDRPVREVMQTELVTVDKSTPLSEVERVIAEANVGGVPVLDEAGQVVGVLSLRDLVDRYTEDPESRPNRAGFYHVDADDLDEDELESFEIPVDAEETAAQVMSEQVFWVPPHAPLREVAREMVRHEVHRLLVQDPESGQTIGIVSTMDILRAMAADADAEARRGAGAGGQREDGGDLREANENARRVARGDDRGGSDSGWRHASGKRGARIPTDASDRREARRVDPTGGTHRARRTAGGRPDAGGDGDR